MWVSDLLHDWAVSFLKGKRMNIYSLFDRKMKEYGPLLVMQNEETMKRSLRDAIPQSQSVVSQHPEDFDLMLLGAFDSDTGQIAPEEVPHLVDNLAVILPPRRDDA